MVRQARPYFQFDPTWNLSLYTSFQGRNFLSCSGWDPLRETLASLPTRATHVRLALETSPRLSASRFGGLGDLGVLGAGSTGGAVGISSTLDSSLPFASCFCLDQERSRLRSNNGSFHPHL